MGKGYKKKRNKNRNHEHKPKPEGVHGNSGNYIQMVTDRGNFRMEYVYDGTIDFVLGFI
jgi:hypothetical protein